MKIQILVDNPSSWIVPYAMDLRKKLSELGHNVFLLHSEREIVNGDILCLLSCEKIFKRLYLNTHNLVVHESALPKGRGWSPVSWQVLEGESRIPVTLFEATESVDDGPIYSQLFIELEGHELWGEIKYKQGTATQELILKFVSEYSNTKSESQVGEATYYPRRTAAHSELSIHKTINEQFNLLRICDNERYPAFFMRNGIKYILKIEKADTKEPTK